MTSLYDFRANLSGLKNSVRNRYIRQAAQAGGRVVAREMRRRARDKSRTDSGALGRSIRAVTRTNRRTGVTTVYVGPSRKYELVGPVRDRRVKRKRGAPVKMRTVNRRPARYAHLVEFGAGPHDIVVRTKTGQLFIMRHPGHKPEPFARPAYEASRQEAVRAFNMKMEQLLTLPQSRRR